MHWLAIPIFALGLLILWLGLRGVRVDDHPVCRKCRFDLVGRPPAAEPVCPKCGSKLDSPRATRTGNRRRSRRAIIAGALVLKLTAAGVGGVSLARARGFNWNSVKSLWLLKLDARGHSPGPALDEILTRIAAKRLSPQSLDLLAGEALALQSDRTKPWEPKWGDVVEVMHLSGSLDPESWKTYVKQAVSLTLVPRSPVRVGDPVPFRVLEDNRVGNGMLLGLELNVAALNVDGEEGSLQRNPDPRFKLGPEHKGSFSMYGNSTLRTIAPEHRGPGWKVKPYVPDPLQNYAWLHTWPRATKTGRGELTVTLNAKFSEHNRGEQVLPDDSSLSRPLSSSVLVEQSILLHAAFEVVPAGTQTVTLVSGDLELRAQVAREITSEDTTSRTGTNRAPRAEVGHSGLIFARGMIGVGPLPVGIAFDVFWKRGDKEWPVGRIAREASQQRVFLGYNRALADFESGPIEVVLRPSIDAALDEPDLTTIWGEALSLSGGSIQVVDPRNPE